MYVAMGGDVTDSTAQYVKLYQLDDLSSMRLEALRRLAYWFCSLFKVRVCRAVSRRSFSALLLVFGCPLSGLSFWAVSLEDTCIIT